jgi:hypothetical protein
VDAPTSLRLPPDVLRERVLELLRRHWVAPRVLDLPERVPPEQVEDLARAALDTMLTRQFRVGPLPEPAVYEQLLDRVRRKVRKGRRIRVAVGYGPLKNQNAVPYSRADWAEFFALCHLVAWHNKVQAVYPPGLEIRIVFDDATLSMANGADPALMQSYMTSLPELIRALHIDALFLPTMRQSTLAMWFHLGLYQLAGWRVRRWERDPSHQAQIERMHEFARRNLSLPSGMSEMEREHRYREASHRYRVYWEALMLSRFANPSFRVTAMYLDGSQHHRPHPTALHLTTLDKGQVTQPWQGEGALLDNGHGKLEPFVLTAGRRQKYAVQTVDQLKVVPVPGFDRIQIASGPSGEK